MRLVLAVLVAAFALGGALEARASGFSLYEPSAKHHAFGGAVIGRAIDASANFANPATLTDLTNLEVTVGFVTEHPRGTVSVSRNGTRLGETKMNSGLFWLPHVMLAAPLPADFTFGLGFSAEYGLGTTFDEGWPMRWSCTDTEVQGLVFNPNLAYRLTEDWSVAVGLRWLYFDFEQYKDMTVAGMFPMDYKLKGDNGWKGFGWQIGTKYDILENLSVGIMYKAQIETTIEGRATGRCRSSPSPYVPASAVSRAFTGDADADITLPQSVTFGLNYDPVSDWHVGVAFSWTEWSQLDQLVFNLPKMTGIGASGPIKDDRVASPVVLNWQDTWRASLGVAWDFAEDWTWMISYTYDMDSTSDSQCSAMLPPASRHIAATGFSWKLGWGFEATLSYACIFMHGFDMRMSEDGSVSSAPGEYCLKTQHGFCHAGGFSLTYRF